MKRLWTFILFSIILLLLFSCSPTQKANKHLRKAKKHILKAESFGAKWQVDTVFKEVAVMVPQIERDTIFRSEVGDTVLITKDRLQVRYVRLAGDSVFIEGKCLADTVYKTVPITVTRNIATPDKWKTPAIALALILVVIIAAGLLYIHIKEK